MIHIGDCREVMRKLIAEGVRVDVVIADPPYGETNLEWDRWPEGWLLPARHMLKETGSMWLFGSLRMFLRHGMEIGQMAIAQEVVWEKHNGSGSHADRFRRVHELVLQLYRAEAPWRGVYKKPLYSEDATARTIRRKQKPQQWGAIGEHFYESIDGGPRMLRSVWCCRSEHGVAMHPTQKPEAIIAPLIEYSCPPGGTILDPFAGSGTVAACAAKLGRKCISIESNPAYGELIKQRTRGTLGLELVV